MNPKADADSTGDPVVDEVRAIRRRLWQDAGNSVEKFIERLDRDLPRDGLTNPRSATAPLRPTK